MRTNRTHDNSDTDGKLQAVLFLSMARARPGTKGNEPIAIAAQRDLGRDRARELNADIVGEFVEVGAAATRWQARPVVNELLAYLDEHPAVRYVIFPGTHRLSRKPDDFHDLMRQFDDRGVVVAFSSGGYELTPTARDALGLNAEWTKQQVSCEGRSADVSHVRVHR